MGKQNSRTFPGLFHFSRAQFLPNFVFSPWFIQNWEEIEPLKNEKVLEKSLNSVFPFPYNPCLNTMFCLLSVSCPVVELFCSHTHDRYANSMLYILTTR